MKNTFDLAIFDCDGVLIDSELIICSAEAQALTTAGYEISTEDLIKRFCGVLAQSMYRIIEAERGHPLPASLPGDVQQIVFRRYRSELRPIKNAFDVLTALKIKACVASGSAPEKLALGLTETGLFDLLHPHIYSSELVARGKPYPDIFEYAARQLDVTHDRCIVCLLYTSPSPRDA